MLQYLIEICILFGSLVISRVLLTFDYTEVSWKE